MLERGVDCNPVQTRVSFKHYITNITLHYITLHNITLHYITLQTLHYITLQTLHQPVFHPNVSNNFREASTRKISQPFEFRLAFDCVL